VAVQVGEAAVVHEAEVLLGVDVGGISCDRRLRRSASSSLATISCASS
jgi:hypothetical protein